MIFDWSKVKLFVKPGPTDMRKQINGLSVITADKNGLEPYHYLRYLFIMLPKAQSREEKRALLPHGISIVDMIMVLI